VPSRGDAKLPLALDCLEEVEVKWVKWLEVGDANSGTRLIGSRMLQGVL